MANNTVSLRITADEKSIIDDIKEIGYGEIYVVRANKEGIRQPKNMSGCTRNLILLLRTGITITALTVHNGEPTMAEILSNTKNNRQCIIKHKF